MNIDTPDEEIEIHNERIVSTEVAVKVAEEFFRHCILKGEWNMDDCILQVIEERCRKATSGPWKSFVEGRDFTSGSSFIQTAGEDIE